MMNRSQVAFKLIDIFMYYPQNEMQKFRGIISKKDIAYSHRDPVDTKGDLYVKRSLIKSKKKLPVVLYIHGGGFVMGDKKYRRGISEWWADKGYFVFNISYRLSPKVHFPENLVDLAEAINYLNVLAEKYPIDLNKVVVTGDSSGGYSSVYLSAIAFNDALRKNLNNRAGIDIPEVTVKPALIVPCCGIYDIDTLVANRLPFKMIDVTAETYTGFTFEKNMSNFDKYPYIDVISPEGFVNEKWPKVFMTWTESDLICKNQGKPMYNALCRKIGKKNIGYYVSHGLFNNHCYHLNQATKESIKCLEACNAFCKKALGV